MAYDKKLTWQTEAYDLNGSGTGDVPEYFVPGARVRVHAIGFVCTQEAIDANASPVVVADLITNGTRGAADGGSITIPASTAIGYVLEDNISASSSVFPYTMNKNDALVFQCTTAANSTGIGHFYVEYEIIQETNDNNDYVSDSA